MTIFDDGADTPINIGDVVKFDGAISSFNGKSLTTKAVQVIDDADLKEWFVVHAYDTFEEITEVSS